MARSQLRRSSPDHTRLGTAGSGSTARRLGKERDCRSYHGRDMAGTQAREKSIVGRHDPSISGGVRPRFGKGYADVVGADTIDRSDRTTPATTRRLPRRAWTRV